MPHATNRMDLAGGDLTTMIRSRLAERGISFTRSEAHSTIAQLLQTVCCSAATCASGYHTFVNGAGCDAWGGLCNHGTLRAQASRTTANHCGSCSSGYHISGTSCLVATNKYFICCFIVVAQQ